MKRFTAALCLLLCGACVTAPPSPPPATTSRQPLPPGIDATALDESVDPCDDFYRFACGGWMAKTSVPADRPLYSRGFAAVIDRNELVERRILEDAAAGVLPAGTPYAALLGAAWRSCTDEPALERSLPEVMAFIAQHATVPPGADAAKVIADLHRFGFRPFFAVGSQQDQRHAEQMIIGLRHGGLGMPDRELYLQDSERARTVRARYAAWVAQVFTRTGDSPELAAQKARAVLALEVRLARVSMRRVDRRDPLKTMHHFSRATLADEAPGFGWTTYFASLGLARSDVINVDAPEAMREFAALVNDTKPADLDAYLAWVVLRSATLALPKAFQQASFEFLAESFSGAKEDRPRWKKCVSWVDQELGEALGREFVRQVFPETSKQRAVAMVTAVSGAVEANLDSLEWMDEATREQARVKARAMLEHDKIGYPERWRDYGGLELTGSLFANELASARFETARQLAKAGQRLDRTEWLMSPPTVNAYHEGQRNEIVFPAGILQPPFFDAGATDAVNFGAMGMVVGHEITHGFDDQGRKYDAAGNLADWWSPASGQAFVEKAACVQRQFDAYPGVAWSPDAPQGKPIARSHVDGALTLGENVADLGGLKLAYAAMLGSTKGQRDDGYRYDRRQQFFLGFAQLWCTQVRVEQAEARLSTDSHAPPYWRVNGPLGNLEAFRAAFKCAEGSKMVRPAAERCAVW